MAGLEHKFAMFSRLWQICQSRAGMAALLAALCWATWSLGVEEPDRLVPAADSPGAELGTRKAKLRREGTELRDEPGHFVLAGTRINFLSTSGEQLIALENLNLERIGRIMTSTPDSVEWLVSGTITEFQGSNYLSVKRATRKIKDASKGQGPASGLGRPGKRARR
jgi:hypothetical protein